MLTDLKLFPRYFIISIFHLRLSNDIFILNTLLFSCRIFIWFVWFVFISLLRVLVFCLLWSCFCLCSWTYFIFLHFLFYFFNFYFYFILLYNTVLVFAIHWHESTMGVHEFPIMNPPTTSHPISSLWIIPLQQPQASF